ncbi:MAG: carboxypeptidase-like regulatory domain-containing protein, partial [Nocardioides sp.]|nr:carboxypeptidase-like regulatory domain-containing protein [Nocardioides sp.]
MKTSRLAALLALALLVLGLQVPAHAAAGDVTGRVVAPAGTSPRGLVVELVDLRNLRRSASTRPDATGRFSFPGGERPELFAVRVCEAGGELCKHVSTRIAERYVGPANGAWSLMALRAYFETGDTSPALALPTIRLVRPATATVRVRNGAAPRRSRTIEVSGLTKPHTSNTLTFRGLAPGRHLAHAFGQQRRFTVAAGGSKVVTFGTRLAKVTGRVVVGGRPRAGVPVALTGASGRPVGVTTNADGRYTFPELNAAPRLTYELRIGQTSNGSPRFAPGMPKALKRFVLKPGQTRRVDLTVAPRSRGWLDVVVDGTTPKRVGSVRLLTTSGTLIGSTSVEYGRVRIDGLAPATYVVYARWNPSSEDRVVNAWRTVTVRAGRGTSVPLEPRTGPGSITVTAQPGNDVSISAPGPAGTGDVPLAR